MTPKWSNSKQGTAPGLDAKAPASSQSPSSCPLSSHLTKVSQHQPQPGPVLGNGDTRLTGQDPVLQDSQNHLVLLTKKPPRRENRRVVVGQGWQFPVKLLREMFWSGGAAGGLS